MSNKQIIPFKVDDISALAKSLVKQVSDSNDELGHSRMLNYLSKAAGYGNWHHLLADHLNQLKKIDIDINLNDDHVQSCEIKAKEYAQDHCELVFLKFKFEMLLLAKNTTVREISRRCGYSEFRVLECFENTVFFLKRSEKLKNVLFELDVDPDWYYGHKGEYPDCFSADAIKTMDSKTLEIKEEFKVVYDSQLHKLKTIDAMDTSVSYDFS